MLNQRIGKASITPIIYYIIVNSTGAITPLLRLSEFKCASIGAEKGEYALIED